MLDRFFCFGIVVITCAFFSQAQSVSFSSPVPWVTQRNDSINIRTQIDTAKIKDKPISVKVVQFSSGKKMDIASKKFQSKDVSADFSFGSIKKSLVGGDEYLQIEWSIPGTEEKGIIEPIGIVQDKNFIGLERIIATKVGSINDIAQIGSQQYKKLGDIQFATAWSKDAFYIAVKKDPIAKSITKFCFDGKNGKSAFLSYPDRIVEYLSETDSVEFVHYSRNISDNRLNYQENSCSSNISVQKQGEIMIVTVPWYDTGIIPFEERTIGFGLFAETSDGKSIGAIPATAKFKIPGTWTDVLLSK